MISSLLQFAFLMLGLILHSGIPARPQAQEQARSVVLRFVKNPDPAPTFELKDLNGNPLSLKDAKGKVVLLNFWATWCGPCRAEIPDLIQLQKKYKDHLEIIGLATEEDNKDPAVLKKFVTEAGINYRVALAPENIEDEYGGVEALPTSFVIDEQGRVVQKHVGLNDPSIYDLEVRALLGQPVDAKVEYFEDTGQIFLTNADRATQLPGVDFSNLTPTQKKVALRKLNTVKCTCGCDMTLAQCRISDPACDTSQGMAAKIVAEVKGSTEKANQPTKVAETAVPKK